MGDAKSNDTKPAEASNPGAPSDVQLEIDLRKKDDGKGKGKEPAKGGDKGKAIKPPKKKIQIPLSLVRDILVIVSAVLMILIVIFQYQEIQKFQLMDTIKEWAGSLFKSSAPAAPAGAPAAPAEGAAPAAPAEGAAPAAPGAPAAPPPDNGASGADSAL